jgi:DNA-binding MurR/RpiR family transcriptional regulator
MRRLRQAAGEKGTVRRQVLATLRAACADMSPALSRIGEYVLAQPDRIMVQTVTELAEQSGASEASVIRFCRDLGFFGFQDFKLTIATELASLPQPERRSAEGDEIGGIVDAAIAALKDTQQLLEVEAVATAVNRLLVARRIHLFGIAASAVTVRYLLYKLVRLGLTAAAHDDLHMASMAATSLTRQDVAVAVSTTGSTIDTVRAAEVAHKAGAFLVAITNRRKSPLARIADVVLLAASAETPLTGGALASRISQLLVVDVLFEKMAAQDRHARASIQTTAASVADRGY